MSELAKAYVQIVPSARGIKGQIETQMGGDMDAAGSSLGGMLGMAIKGAVVAAGIGKAISASISAGADLQQSLGGIETLFKESADNVKANAAEAYRTAGMSANEYMEMTTGFAASLLSSLGGDTQKAADVADMAMTDMSDNMNKMGSNMEDIKNAYQGFSKQNYTMLDNLKLGYGGTQSEMQRLLDDAQKISGVEYDISNLGDVYSAIHVIQDELGITGTTALEASTTFSGSFASMKAAAKDLLGNLSIGADITGNLEALKETVSIFLLDNLFPMIGNIILSLPTFLMGMGDIGLSLVTTMLNSITTQLPNVLIKGQELLSNLINGIVTGLPDLISTAMTTAKSFINGILQQLPSILQMGSTLILNLVNGIIQNLPNIVSASLSVMTGFSQEILRNLPSILQSGIEIIGKLAAGLIQAIPDLVSKIPEIIKAIINTFTSTNWLEVGTNIISGIANGLANAGHMLWDAVKGILGSFKDNVLEFFGIHSPSRWGIWVGNMIMEGLGGGLENLLPIKSALNTMTGLFNPFSADLIYSAKADMAGGMLPDNSGMDSIYALLAQMLGVLKTIVSGSEKEIVINCNDRELARVLKEMGVAFE